MKIFDESSDKTNWRLLILAFGIILVMFSILFFFENSRSGESVNPTTETKKSTQSDQARQPIDETDGLDTEKNSTPSSEPEETVDKTVPEESLSGDDSGSRIETLSEIVRGNQNKKAVIFTFDAGSGTDSIEKILTILNTYNLKGSFFLTGKWAETNPDYTKQIVDGGNEIFNHTYSHPHLTKISPEEMVDEIEKTDQLIQFLTGNSTKPFLRPPYGDRNAEVAKTASQFGYQMVYWTVDALDWKESEGITQDEVKNRVYDNLAPGVIYMFHIGDNISGNILEELILGIQSLGYQILPLSKAL